MKHIIIALLVLTVLATPAHADISTLIDSQLLRYEPIPAQPGDTLDVYLQITNNGNQAERGISVTLQDNEYFTVLGEDTFNIGTLASQGTYVASYRVRVSSEAAPGTNELVYTLTQTGQTGQTRTFEIPIREEDQQVYVSNVATSNDEFRPGAQQTITLSITNAADRSVRDVTVELDLDDVPFSPLQSTSRRQIDTIGARSTQDITFPLAVEPDAAANLYSIPVSVTFIDLNGDDQIIEETVGVRVNSETRTQAYIDDVSWVNEELELSLRIVNTGLSELKFVSVEIQDSEAYNIPRQERLSYLGNIESDDWETMRFTLTSEQEEITIPVTYTYQDAFNNEQRVNQEFTVELPAQPSQGSGGILFWIIVIALVIGGIFWWKKRKAKK